MKSTVEELTWRTLIIDFTEFAVRHSITNLEFVHYWKCIISFDDIRNAFKYFESIRDVFEIKEELDETLRACLLRNTV